MLSYRGPLNPSSGWGNFACMNTNSDTNPSAEDVNKLYCIRVTRGDGPIDEQLAAAMREVNEASDRDPNSWHNNPAKQRAALEGLGKLLDEWEAENGPFSEEEMARAYASLYGE